MSETMIERAARAIYEKRNGAGCVPWSRRPSAHKDPYLADARAAIEAIREPTDAIMSAMKFPSNSDCWRAGIDAALSPASNGEK